MALSQSVLSELLDAFRLARELISSVTRRGS